MASRLRLRAEGRRPPQESLSDCHTFRRFVAGTVEYHPNVRFPVVDPSVADRFAVIGLLASRHKDEL